LIDDGSAFTDEFPGLTNGLVEIERTEIFHLSEGGEIDLFVLLPKPEEDLLVWPRLRLRLTPIPQIDPQGALSRLIVGVNIGSS
jgi:hypothetical protein